MLFYIQRVGYLLQLILVKSLSPTPTHFFCLSQCKQEVVPTTNREKDALLEAGLGEKKIVVPDIDMTGEEFRYLILQEFQ